MDEARLKSEVRAVVEAEFAAPAGRDPAALAWAAFDALGSPDPELRDALAYSVLATWIHDDVLAPEAARELLLRAVADDTLFAGLGERESDTVFRRSFSLLVVAVGLIRHTRRPLLAAGDWRHVLERILAYCERERDVRAFVLGKGWAHAIAHASDAVDELVRGEEATPADCARLRDALATLAERAETVFQGEEDERIAIALAAMLTTGKTNAAELQAWLASRRPHAADPQDPVTLARRVNWKLVARSLYFRLRAEGRADDAAGFEAVQRELGMG